mgnify:FL=1|tara:strand:+ start:1270 stop:1815 length:546 start_codon:yes stop_codon:yes gene_type:complete
MEEIMPTSLPVHKDSVFEHIRTVVLNHLPTHYKILDVGPGEGTYGAALQDLYVDALEIHEPYVHQYRINRYYNNIFIGDILNFNYDDYDYIILGDVLEHLHTAHAQKLIKDINSKGIKCLVAVPYLHEQDAVNGVESEIHHQPDLTPRVMQSRYPDLEIFLTTNTLHQGYAYYTNYLKWVK